MPFDPQNPIQSVFADFIGRPAWQVQRGYGSFLTFEFGAPRLIVREPRTATSESEKVRAGAARRLITARGDWHLWIYCCDWEVRSGGSLIGTSSDDDEAMARAAKILDGQKLSQVAIGALRAPRVSPSTLAASSIRCLTRSARTRTGRSTVPTGTCWPIAATAPSLLAAANGRRTNRFGSRSLPMPQADSGAGLH